MPVYRTLVAFLFVFVVATLLLAEDRPRNSGITGDKYLAHLSTDKPIYRAGEKVYLRGVILGANARKPLPPDKQHFGNLQIAGPKGEVIVNTTAVTQESISTFAWEVPDESAGGQYTATVSFPWNGLPPAERKFEVRAYRAPRLKGEIIFLRDGFGAGDVVKASLKVERAEGGIPAGAQVHASAIVDGANAFSGDTKVEANGNVSVEFKLPTMIEKGDGTLALAITDGGVVETISKSIPIIVRSVDLSICPEGGELIAGLPCRVYLEARTPAQKPADLVGALIDSKGNEIAPIKTEHEGRGRFTFTPAAGETYSIKLSQPSGITKTFPLPATKADGVTLSCDQLVIEPGEAVKLQMRSTQERNFHATLSRHGTEVAAQGKKQTPAKFSEVELTPPTWADGVLVATVWDKDGKPLAERLVFRRPARSLRVSVEPDKSTYIPGGAASVTVTTTDDAGKPISAMVGITATDESVLQMIEKRERAPRLPVMVLLENDVRELADAEIYLNPQDPKAPLAVDLLLGTQGWRRFATADEAKFLAEFGDAGRRALADLAPPPPPRTVTAAAAMPEGAVRFGAGLEQEDGGGRGGQGLRLRADRFRLVDKNLAAPQRQPKAPAEEQKLERAQAAKPAQGPLAAEPRLKQRIAADALMESQPTVPPVRIYAHELREGRKPGERVDFTETLYWCAGVKTDAKTGKATISFKLNDSVTSFKVMADAFDDAGTLGESTAIVNSVQPFYIEPKIPLEVSCGDLVRLPVAAVNGTSDALGDVRLNFAANNGITLSPVEPFALAANGRARRVTELTVGAMPTRAELRVNATAGGYSDGVTRELLIRPLGFPIEIAHGGVVNANNRVSHSIEIPASLVAGSVVTNIALYPTPLANMTEALQRLMQEPNGCFEQTSSTAYPLVMADQYFLSHTGVDPAIIARCNELLARGYDKLKGFECKDKGYEWFGQSPGHECLSAFGLLEFTDMAQVREVDSAMLANTRKWLLARRDGKGEFTRERRALHTWVTDPGCANGYCTWALLECGEKNLDAEVKWMKDRCATDDNSYVTALGANILHLAGDKEGARALMDRLAKSQDKNGHVQGGKTTVVGSGGESLQIETTSLATLAWLREPSFAGNVERGINFLADSCKAGRFGSTQSTVLALRAIVAYDKSRAHPAAAGSIRLLVDGEPVGEAIPFDAQTHGAIKLPEIAGKLTPGRHEIALAMADGSNLPYAVAVSFNSLTPASSDECKLRLTTSLKDARLDEGAPSEAAVTVSNVTDETLPSPIAIIGLPGGLEVRHDQLKELVKADRISAYEVRGREVILYWRDIQPKAKVEIPLSVIAAVPGEYTAPASRAYLYYTDEFKQWAEGMKVTIDAK